MPQSLSNLIMHLKPYWLDGASAVMGIELNKIIHYPLVGSAVFYDKTAAGLTSALAAATAGEIVQIHGPCALTGNFTVPDGAGLIGMERDDIQITGYVTLGEGSLIYNTKVYYSASSAGAVYGVQGPTIGTAYIYYCDITAINSGAGNAYAIGAINGTTVDDGNIIIRHSKLYGSATGGGSGYAGRSINGKIYSRHNDYYGSTDRWALV